MSVPKIASTTAHYLMLNSGILGPDDICTSYEDGAYETFNLPKMTLAEMYDVLDPIKTFYPDKNGEIYDKNGVFEKLCGKFGGPEGVCMWMNKTLFKHLTLEEAVRAGFIKEEDLDTYDIFGFVRDPIDSYVSVYFFANYANKSESSLEGMIADIDTIVAEDGPWQLFGRKPRDSFFYKGKQIVKALPYSNYKYEMEKLVAKFGGTLPDPLPRFKGESRPEWARQPIETWLPAESLAKLKVVLADEIAFYEEVLKV